MKRAKIYIDDIFCGILTEGPDGYGFKYTPEYLAMNNAKPVSPTMPLQNEEYEKEIMFPVFDGLIPEGWMLDIVHNTWKIDPRDRMSLLLACCKDCIGNISVRSYDD
ncbi:MAG: HipA N-terminal domain-containing protein [Bacteroidales bacterium]|nr:HipA N-terminal domain-containing protein [Bacteroidales bacterium]